MTHLRSSVSDPRALTVFMVSNARPEARHNMQASHVATVSTSITVSMCLVLAVRYGTLIINQEDGSQRSLDLVDVVCRIGEVLASTFLWRVSNVRSGVKERVQKAAPAFDPLDTYLMPGISDVFG